MISSGCEIPVVVLYSCSDTEVVVNEAELRSSGTAMLAVTVAKLFTENEVKFISLVKPEMKKISVGQPSLGE